MEAAQAVSRYGLLFPLVQAADYRAEYRCRCRNGDYLWVADCGRIVTRNPDGSVAVSDFRVNTTTLSNQGEPVITALEDGGFVIAL